VGRGNRGVVYGGEILDLDLRLRADLGLRVWFRADLGSDLSTGAVKHSRTSTCPSLPTPPYLLLSPPSLPSDRAAHPAF